MAPAVSGVLAPIHRKALASTRDRRVSGAFPRDPVRLLLLSLLGHGGLLPAGLEPNQGAQEIPGGTAPEPLRIVLAPFHRDNPSDIGRSCRSLAPPESRRSSAGSADIAFW